VVHPGASWSTADVWRGLHDAFKRAGCEVIEYALDGRIQAAYNYLQAAYNGNPNKEALPAPSHADTLFLASEGIVTRALWFEVDWVFVVACGWLHPEVFRMSRRAGLRTALLFTESPNEDAYQLAVAQHIDVCWTNERTSLPAFRAVCPAAHYWRHAIDPARHSTQGDAAADVPAHDVVFVGTGWAERCELLEAIDWTGIDLGLYGSWELLAEDSPLRAYVRGGITPNELTAELYRRVKIGLNLHRISSTYSRTITPHAGSVDALHAESLNPRCYELAAVGCFFMTDARAEVREIFGDRVPTFSGPADLEAQLRYWLAHEAERVAAAAQLPACVAGATFDARAAEILGILEDYGHV
jgi:hypothetical protein